MKRNAVFLKKIWKYFSLDIRLSECFESTGSYEQGYCCTCHQLTQFCDLDAGHYLSGRTNSILFVRELVHIQCRTCNQMRGGMYKEYKIFMENKYGKEKVRELENLKFKSKKFFDEELEDIYKNCLNKIEEMGFLWMI